jgi:L,D-peptidoglycan transpeptidase YkuD (ErfK/YbiS/YcfS/YnhG family)
MRGGFRLRKRTDGCIAVTDEEMDEIWRAVPDGTPIEIQP